MGSKEYYQCMDCGAFIFNAPELPMQCGRCDSFNVEDGYSKELEDKILTKRAQLPKNNYFNSPPEKSAWIECDKQWRKLMLPILKDLLNRTKHFTFDEIKYLIRQMEE